jgi:large subunit ribosomal protein L4
MKLDIYTESGEKDGQMAVSDIVFGAKINEDLMHRAVVMRLANRRNPIAHTKTRGEVVGSTRKIFRQKGTGNARRGSRYTNILRGGGVTHGPRNDRNFSLAMPKKERRAALFSSLTLRASEGDAFALDNFSATEPKTKDFVAMLSKLPIGKKYLFVIPFRNRILQKSASNVPNVDVILACYINPYDVLKAEKVCFLKESLEVIETTFVSKK